MRPTGGRRHRSVPEKGSGAVSWRYAVDISCHVLQRVCSVSPEGKSNSNTIVDNRIIEVDSKPRENCRDAKDETRNLRTHKDEMV